VRKTPFEEVAVDWLAGLNGIRERTEIGYRSLLDRHVLPHFAFTPVAKITRQDVNEYVRSLEHKNLGAGTIRNIMRDVLKPVLDVALEAGMIPANPCERLRLPMSQRQEMCFLTADEVELLADAMRLLEYGLLVRFAAYTGLRAGEISALRVGRLDLMRRRVVVAESAVELPGKGLVAVAPKNGRVREVPLPVFLDDPLALLVEDRAADPEAFTFLSPQGKQLRHGNFYRHHFRPAVANALPDKPGLRFHDLRHTCASLLIHLNENPKAIQTYLGHSSVQVTIDRYGHLMPDWQDRLVGKLDTLYRETSAEDGDDRVAGQPTLTPRA
jgi:integrase